MFDPSKFLEFARKLLKEGDKFDEGAKDRTIINRSYFSSLLLTKIKLNTPVDPFPTDDKIHQVVVDRLRDKDKNLGNLLFTLHENRLKADLDLDYAASREVNDSIGLAGYLEDQIKNL